MYGRRALLAAYEAGGEADWSVIFEGYRATQDWPTVHFWEQLATAYPDAKILLTDRDPERWWDSHAEMFQLGADFDRELTDGAPEWTWLAGMQPQRPGLNGRPGAGGRWAWAVPTTARLQAMA
jgi:hypothetical protein